MVPNKVLVILTFQPQSTLSILHIKNGFSLVKISDLSAFKNIRNGYEIMKIVMIKICGLYEIF